MDSRQLRYFIAVYEQRNLSRAADQASVAQSALSHHISNLEAEFATPLFERKPRGMEPTAAGERLYEHARIILRAMAAAEREIKQGGGIIAGDISIGMANSGVKAIGVPLMKAVLAKYPNLKLSLTESLSGATLLHLMASEVDLALVYNPQSEKDLIAEPVLEEQMFCVGTAKVIGKSKAPITFEELTRLPLILLRHGLSSRALLDDPVLLKRLEANVILHLNSISGTTGALLAGLGCAVATKLFVQEQLGAGSLIAREVVEPTLTRTLYLCRLRNRPMTYAMEEMRRLMLALIAVPVVAALSWWLVPLSPSGVDGWRWVVLAGAAGSMVIWVLRLLVPESPLWLARHGRTGEAVKILRTLEASSGAAHAHPEKIADVLPARTTANVSFAELFRPPYVSLVVLFMVFNFCQAFGFYGFANWVPALLVEKGITVTKSLQYSFIIAFAYPISPLLAASFADRFERKWIICDAVAAVGCFGIAFSQFAQPELLILCGVLITAANTTMSYAYHAYQTEVFPTSIRARASGLVYSMSRISAAFSGFIIAYVLREAGVGGVFGLITSAMVIVIVAIAAFGPNVRGKPLDA